MYLILSGKYGVRVIILFVNKYVLYRLAIMRLIYGIATRMGFGEQISEALNGAFVPPGVDDYSDYGGAFSLFGRDDDDDYDYR